MKCMYSADGYACPCNDSAGRTTGIQCPAEGAQAALHKTTPFVNGHCSLNCAQLKDNPHITPGVFIRVYRNVVNRISKEPRPNVRFGWLENKFLLEGVCPNPERIQKAQTLTICGCHISPKAITDLRCPSSLRTLDLRLQFVTPQNLFDAAVHDQNTVPIPSESTIAASASSDTTQPERGLPSEAHSHATEPVATIVTIPTPPPETDSSTPDPQTQSTTTGDAHRARLDITSEDPTPHGHADVRVLPSEASKDSTAPPKPLQNTGSLLNRPKSSTLENTSSSFPNRPEPSIPADTSTVIPPISPLHLKWVSVDPEAPKPARPTAARRAPRVKRAKAGPGPAGRGTSKTKPITPTYNDQAKAVAPTQTTDGGTQPVTTTSSASPGQAHTHCFPPALPPELPAPRHTRDATLTQRNPTFPTIPDQLPPIGLHSSKRVHFEPIEEIGIHSLREKRLRLEDDLGLQDGGATETEQLLSAHMAEFRMLRRLAQLQARELSARERELADAQATLDGVHDYALNVLESCTMLGDALEFAGSMLMGLTESSAPQATRLELLKLTDEVDARIADGSWRMDVPSVKAACEAAGAMAEYERLTGRVDATAIAQLEQGCAATGHHRQMQRKLSTCFFLLLHERAKQLDATGEEVDCDHARLRRACRVGRVSSSVE